MGVPDPFEEYNKYVDKMLKEDPTAQQMGRLCYEVFIVNKEGKELLKKLEENILSSASIKPNDPGASSASLYWAGYNDSIKTLRFYAKEHQKRITECQV